MSKSELQRAHKLCEQAGAWLIVDNTYEHFTYDGREHTCVSGQHVVNIFSMSKVSNAARADLRHQDTNAICACSHSYMDAAVMAVCCALSQI